jgi:hypothetical protein
MKLKGIIFIAGKPGLFKVVGQGKNNIIVENLEDKKRTPAYASDKVSALEDISLYTTDEDQTLSSIFDTIYTKEKGGATINHKEDLKKQQAYLTEIVPNWDDTRVYPSDVKKLFQWYNILHKANALELDETDESEVEKTEVVKEEKSKETKEKAIPKTKVAPKTTAKSTTLKAAAAKAAPKKTGGTRGS